MIEPERLRTELAEERQVFDLDNDALQRWTSIPYNVKVVINLDRHDVDELLFALRSFETSLNRIGNAFVADQLGEEDRAISNLKEHVEKLREGSNHLTSFMIALMRKAEPVNG